MPTSFKYRAYSLQWGQVGQPFISAHHRIYSEQTLWRSGNESAWRGCEVHQQRRLSVHVLLRSHLWLTSFPIKQHGALLHSYKTWRFSQEGTCSPAFCQAVNTESLTRTASACFQVYSYAPHRVLPSPCLDTIAMSPWSPCTHNV